MFFRPMRQLLFVIGISMVLWNSSLVPQTYRLSDLIKAQLTVPSTAPEPVSPTQPQTFNPATVEGSSHDSKHFTRRRVTSYIFKALIVLSSACMLWIYVIVPTMDTFLSLGKKEHSNK